MQWVAVLGVDNDVTLCELADPPLSSIDQDLERIGYEAASLLDRLMAGEARGGDILWVLAASAVVTAVFAPVAMRMYHRER